MSYLTYIPRDALKPFVKVLAISASEEERTYKVLPDTGLVIGFQYKGRLFSLSDHTQMPLAASGLTGLHDTYRVFKNTVDIGTVLVYFKEGGASAFFNEPVHEIFGASLSLGHFVLRSVLLIVEEQLCEAETNRQRIDIVEQFLLQRMRSAKTDVLVLQAISLINKSHGQIRIKEMALKLNISQSPLEKRFRRIVGASPKKYASIVRFKHILNTQKPSESLTSLGYDSGFYDQAHFIKEFKSFTGETPETFFQAQPEK